MQKQQRAKAGMKPPKAGGTRKGTGFPPPFPNAPPQAPLPAKPLIFVPTITRHFTYCNM